MLVLMAYAHMALISDHDDVSSAARDLNLGLSHHLHLHIMYGSWEGSGIAACRCDKYQNLANWPIYMILTHLAYRANAKKRGISNDIVTVLKPCEKRALADIKCYCKMTLDGVTSFLCLKDATYLCKRMRHSQTIGGISLVLWRKVGRS